jgi:hypothetical protein
MATIVVPSEKVIAAADAKINSILAFREKQDNAKIEGAMQPRRFLWFRLKTRTREEAIAWLDKVYKGTFEGWRSIRAWGTLSELEALKKLAQHGDPVTLNENDVNTLF